MISHLSRSPVVSFQEGIDVVARRIFTYSHSAPYIATIRGISGVGKSHFGREVLGKLGFSQRGLFTKPHDLSREQYARDTFKYILLEIDEIDNAYDMIIERKTKDLFCKVPDHRIMVVYDLGRMLDSRITLPRLFSFFDLVVENKKHPNYR
ncbi:MAG: hypothetical protein Q8R47_01710 [Nanoarchaeota archaeon]|nr:hypothetical protein [Nanoarchaeota archaeon]